MSFNISGVPGATEKLWYALEASPQALRGNVLGFAIPTIFLGVTAFQSKRSFFCGHPVGKFIEHVILNQEDRLDIEILLLNNA